MRLPVNVNESERRDPLKLTVHEVKIRLDLGERFVFVDARDSKEWTQSDLKLPGAIRVPAHGVAKHLDVIPQGRTIVTYCASSHEESSARVALELLRRGFLNVHPLIGGFDAWGKAGYPVEPK